MPYNVNQIKQYDMVGAARRGQDRAYQMNERKRKQPILEAMDAAKLKQNAQMIKTNENNLTLQQGKINREAFNQANDGMDLINQETANLEAKGGIPPERIKAYRDKEIAALYNYNARTYGKQTADSFKDNPELMAKVAGGQQQGKGSSYVKGGGYYQQDDSGNYDVQVMIDKNDPTKTELVRTPIKGTGISKQFGETRNQQTNAEVDAAGRVMKSKEDAKWLSKEENTLGVAATSAMADERSSVYKDEYASYKKAKSQATQLSQMDDAMTDAVSGKYGKLRTWFGAYAPGVDISREENMVSLATSYALDELKQQKGSKSDFEFLKAAETAIQAGNSKEGNRMILDRLKQNQRYAKERYKSFKEFSKDNKNLEDFEETFDFSEFSSKREFPTVSSMSGYEKLKSGDQYYDKNGNLARKK